MKVATYLLCFLCVSSLSSQTIYFQESFDDCSLPDGWETEEPFESKGWIVGNSSQLSSDLLRYPDDNGNCFAANNDSKWDDVSGEQNVAKGDKIILPYLDVSDAEDLVISFDYISGYRGSFKLLYRTANSDWIFINNTVYFGGVLQWQKKTVHAYGHVNAPMISLTEPVQFMLEFSDYGFPNFLGAGVDNIKIYDPATFDMVLENVHIPEVVPVGLIPITAAIKNHGKNQITSAKFKWQINDGAIESKVINQFKISNGAALNFMLPFGSGAIPSPSVLIDFQDEGTYTLKIWLESANGQEDDNPEDNYWEGTVIVKNELPTKHYIYEKFSHHTCSPCYEADLLAQQITEEYDNIHLVSVHSSSSDPMDYPPVDEIDIAYSQRTHPGTILDRRFLDTYENGQMSSLYSVLPELTTPWWSPVDVYFTSKEVDEATGKINIEIEAQFITDLEGEYRFNIWTLENEIVAYQAGSPEGNNYVHNHVLRNYTGGNYGAEGSLPISIEANKKYTYSASIDIDPSWNLDNLEFIAVVQRYEEDSDNRDLVNASSILIDEHIVVNQQEEEKLKFNIYPNPTNQFLHIVLDEKVDIDFSMSIYNILGELVAHRQITNLQQNYLQYDVSEFAAGNYLLVINSAEEKQLKQFTVVK